MILLGATAGMSGARSYVQSLSKYDHCLVLRWVDLPDWLALPDNRHVLDGLTRRVNLLESDRPLDAGLAARLGEALADPRTGWVKSVERVRIEPSGDVSVKCRFREPAAWVRIQQDCYLIDSHCVRLPGRYELADCAGGPLLIIEGVSERPPDVGQVWNGEDLKSGLFLSAMLADKPFRHQVSGIILANHDGRLDRSRPHIELATDRPGSRIWWGRPPGDDFGTEITGTQKLMLLETLYRQWGRIDMNRSYVNIMTWPDRVAMPAVMHVPAQSRLLRG